MTELGGWSEVKPVTLEVIKICLEVRPIVEKTVETDFTETYIPVVYRSQIVNGENYLVKVLVDEDGVCVHLNIYQTLPCDGGELSVTGIQYPKPFDDLLIPF
ncbi:cystatin-A-like [Onychostoma macrolepis]|uniref:Uncharacterized protein n=1 Tax=Onychostoma macrolepis TaxID=369639 RepID=A0A7J6D3V3_9TELE|nr:cystatin-A-like [Onychostoma macrolepis]XP_058633058.1 cystatin-A-like [Onychostoma macrolepis]KAF4113888.1 hypothetical protein G5714_006433 [Onychostoma macrolepis]